MKCFFCNQPFTRLFRYVRPCLHLLRHRRTRTRITHNHYLCTAPLHAGVRTRIDQEERHAKVQRPLPLARLRALPPPKRPIRNVPTIPHILLVFEIFDSIMAAFLAVFVRHSQRAANLVYCLKQHDLTVIAEIQIPKNNTAIVHLSEELQYRLGSQLNEGRLFTRVRPSFSLSLDVAFAFAFRVDAHGPLLADRSVH